MAVIERVDFRGIQKTDSMVCWEEILILLSSSFVPTIHLKGKADYDDLQAMVNPFSGFMDMKYTIKPGTGGLAYTQFEEENREQLRSAMQVPLSRNYYLLYEHDPKI